VALKHHIQLWLIKPLLTFQWEKYTPITIEADAVTVAPVTFEIDALEIEFITVSNAFRADNEPKQLEKSSRFDSTINSLNLVHEPNEPNLS
jgi:hypothetical protein